MKNYARLAVEFDRGEGAWLWDIAGKRYLDALAGIAVCGLGHAHPAVARAVAEQATRLVHTSNLYGVGAQQALAAELARVTDLDRVFFCNSGTEANEAAIKFARLRAHRQGNDAPVIVTMEAAFHGRTLGALAATDSNPDPETLFGPLPEGFTRVAFDDVAAVERAFASNPRICAVMVEPIQGEGGVRVPHDGYLAALRELCDRNEALLILDEVQTGVGRTGAWYRCRGEDVRPDLLTTAKALGNGVPIGACAADARVAEHIEPGMHGSTFGGNPLACAAALAVLETVETSNLCGRAAATGDYLQTQLRAALDGVPGVVEVRGRGLMIGVELAAPCRELAAQALARGLLINVTAERVVRLLPPLILEREQADEIVATLAELIPSFAADAA